MKAILVTLLLITSASHAKWKHLWNSTTRVITLDSTNNAEDYDSWGNCLSDAIVTRGKKNLVVQLPARHLRTNHSGDSIRFTDGENIIIRGTYGQTRITLGTVQKAVYLRIFDSRNIQIENIEFFGVNLVLNGNGKYGDDPNGVNHRAIHIESDADQTSDITIKNCGFAGFKTGGIVLGPRVFNGFIEGNWFDDVDHKASENGSDRGAIHLDSDSGVTIHNNNYSNLYFSAVSIEASKSVHISNDTASFDPASQGYTMGVYVEGGMSASSVTESEYNGVKAEGISIASTKVIGQDSTPTFGNLLARNRIYSYGYGIALHPDDYGKQTIDTTRPMHYNKIIGNEIYALPIPYDYANQGIRITNSHSTLVQGNLISNYEVNGSMGRFKRGILIRNEAPGDLSSDNIIEGNTITGTADTAMTLGGSAKVVRNYITCSNVDTGAPAIYYWENARTLMFANSFTNCLNRKIRYSAAGSTNIFDFEN